MNNYSQLLRHSRTEGRGVWNLFSQIDINIRHLQTKFDLIDLTKNFHLSTLLYKETVYTELIYSIVQLYR
ncbi:hypothetical protein VISP3789_17733 [Vibrio splendidus ATCC 33789]|nr:hypothetical protein VISP3789_17733 [Vibrio splendidus ATCC 33789]